MIQDKLGPIRQQIQDLMSEPQHIEQILEEGAKRASLIAEETWQDVQSKVGLKLK